MRLTRRLECGETIYCMQSPLGPQNTPPEQPGLTIGNSPEQRTVMVCHHLLTQVAKRSGDFKVPLQTSIEFLDLQKEVGDLLALSSRPGALRLLENIASKHITQVSSLISAAALLNRLYSLDPSPVDSALIERLVDPSAPLREQRESSLRDLGRFVYLCLHGSQLPLPKDKSIVLIDRGMRILDESSLNSEKRHAFVGVLASLAIQQGGFRGIQSLRAAVEQSAPEIDPLAVAEILSAGIRVRDDPRGIAKCTQVVTNLLTGDPRAIQILREAVKIQASQMGSVLRLVDGFSRLYDSYPKAQRAERLERYYNLIDQVRPLKTPIDLISKDIVDQFATSDPQQYALKLAQHLGDLEDIIETAHQSRKIQRQEIGILRELGAFGPNPDLLNALRVCVESLHIRCQHPEIMVCNLDRLAHEFHISGEQWRDLTEILTQQLSKNRALDGVVQRAVEMFARDSDPSYWRCYRLALASLEEQVPDLSLVTTDVVDTLIRNTTLGDALLHFLSDALVCADEMLPFTDASTCSTSSLVRELIQPHSAGSALVRAFALHHKLGLSSSSLFGSFLEFNQSCTPAGSKLLQQIVLYQFEHNQALAPIFRNFLELERFLASSPADSNAAYTWTAASELVGKLMSRGVSLQFFSKAHLTAYVEDSNKEEAIERLSRNLSAIQALSLDRRVGANQQEWLKLLSEITNLGPRSPGPAALEALLTPRNDGGENLTPRDLVQCLGSKHPLSVFAWGEIMHSVDAYRARGDSLRRLCRSIAELDGDIAATGKSTEELWRTARELMIELRESKLPYDLITADFVTYFYQSTEEIQSLLTHFLRGLTRFHERLLNQNTATVNTSGPAITKSVREVLVNITQKSYGLTDNPAMVHKLNLILADGDLTSLSELHVVLRELKMHALTDIMRDSSNAARSDWARKLMSAEFSMGGPPYVEGSPGAADHFNETMQVVDRAHRDSKGFGGLALDTRGIPSCSELEPVPPMLVRFGIDVAAKTCILNASSNRSFPGKGLYIGGINPHKVFTADPGWRAKGKSSPHWRWFEEGGFFASSYFHNFNMRHFEGTQYLAMRGLMCVIPPREATFSLDGIHYSYLVYNRHFYPGTQSALGVPSIILWEILGNSLIDVADFVGFQKSRTDVSTVDFSYRALLNACERRRMNLLDLTYGSVVGGGLCNAYLPRSLPHYKWELDSGEVGGWADTWGHIHKNYRQGSYLEEGPPSLDRALQRARDLHRDVLDVFRPMQDFVSALRLALSFYKMGQVLISDNDQHDIADQQQQGQDQSENPSQRESASTAHEYEYRMLHEAYRWHLGATEQGWKQEQIPVLHFAWVLDPNSLPPPSERRFEIDLATMIVKTRNGNFQLPRDGTGSGDTERELWRQHILPHFRNNSFGWEPRLLMRGGAFTIHE